MASYVVASATADFAHPQRQRVTSHRVRSRFLCNRRTDRPAGWSLAPTADSRATRAARSCCNGAKSETAWPTISADIWRQLKLGSLVLAAGFDEQDNLDGWWEAIMVRVDDRKFLVRWRDDSNDPTVSRRREHIALLYLELTSS